MIEHGEEPSIGYILKVFLIFLAVVVLACMGLKAAIADDGEAVTAAGGMLYVQWEF